MTSRACQICGKALSDPDSIKAGVGPECAGRKQAFLASCGSSLEEIGALTLHADATVRKWIEVAGRAMRKGNCADARRFIEAARRAARRAAAPAEIEQAA